MTSAAPARPAGGSGAVALLGLSPKELKTLGDAQGWSLSETELSAIQAHFKSTGRQPTRAEVETFAQTWSEHCKHKTFRGPILYTEGKKTRVIQSLMDETIALATKKTMKPWCLSVFKDNAGIVSFGKGGKWALAVKVETHNHPCAVEPYGGSETGVGGVVRDVLGAGLGAKPVLNTDTFCVAPPDYTGALPEGALHPRRTLRGVVAGVRDYGNRMGIPTASGGLWFDDEFRLNPLVFAGTVGVMPAWAAKKAVKPGDLIVAAGGRTGRDGLHGATFSSAAVDGGAARAEAVSAVQIGHAINEKRLCDALLRARDKKLYRGVTDCGAGGFSSAIGELGQACGARVRLADAKLKCADLEPWEIWVSESQERMIFAVPPASLKAFEEIFSSEGCETAVLGEFTKNGRLEVRFGDDKIVDLDMKFLHGGCPKGQKKAVWQQSPQPASGGLPPGAKALSAKSLGANLRSMLSHWNVCSREWIIRQYDHEVQAGTVIKPLQGVRHDGPGDACVIWPHAATGDLEDYSGFAVGHGLNPAFGKIDPYRMALACVDESLRNLLCVGADVSRAALLDNFCWGSPEDPARLGGLVRAAQGCRDAALAFKTPFISGKDSFYNQSKDVSGKDLAIPGTLLVTAVAPVSDIRKTITMDFKGPGNPLYLVGWTMGELGGSLFNSIVGREGGAAPMVDLKAAMAGFKAVQEAIAKGWILSAHDLSDGGLGVALAEMAFSGEFGASVDLDLLPVKTPLYSNELLLFCESASRILLEVNQDHEAAVAKVLRKVPSRRIGATMANPIIKVAGLDGSIVMEEPLVELKTLWQKTLPEALR